MMTGRRKSSDVLPPRMYAYHGKRQKTYYTITAANQRVNLGHDLIVDSGFKRSVWRCTKCGKLVLKDK